MSYNKNKHYESNEKSLVTMEEVLSLPIKEISERKLKKEYCELYGAKTATDEAGGVVPTDYFFPVHKQGELSGFIQRVSKNPKNRFFMVGNVDVHCDLFGMHLKTPGKKLFITEGPIDAISLYQALRDYQLSNPKNEKYKHLTPNVWSCCLGVANGLKQILNNKEALREYEEIILVFDNDKATPAQKKQGIVKGMDAVEEISINLGLNVKYVKLPLKDCNDMIKADRAQELAELALFKSQVYTPDLISVVGNVDDEYDIVTEPLKAGYPIDFLPILSSKLGGIRLNEMTLLLSPSGCGKTTLFKNIAAEMVFKRNEKIAVFFLEEDVKKLKQSFVAMDNKISTAKFRAEPDKYISKEDVRKSLAKMQDKIMFYDADKAGLIDVKNIISMLRYCALNGAAHIFFDHLSFAVAGQTEQNDTKLLDTLMAELALIPRAYPVHIWLVAHVSRDAIKSFKPEVDENKNIIYPYWLPIAKESGRSSAALEQCTWNLITLEPEIVNENKEYGRKRIVIHKAREYGVTGVCDIINMNKQTGLFEIAG